MFILDPNRYARDPAGVPRQIDELIEKHQGEMLVSRLWVEQKLAFPIKGQNKGTYWLAYFRLDSGQLADLNHQIKLNDNILRSLVLKIDPRLVDAMVAHASPGSAAAADDSDAKDESKDKDPAKKPAAAKAGADS
jgi:small subunit ribosomal protein S6